MLHFPDHSYGGFFNSSNDYPSLSWTDPSFFPESCSEQPQEKKAQQLYRSQWASKVRVDKWCQKSGCYRTMGPARVTFPQPRSFLKKHSRLPPVFFDPNELKKKESVKEVKEMSPEISLPKIVPPTNRGCMFSHPPKDLGLFRNNSDPPYDELYRKGLKLMGQGSFCGGDGDSSPLISQPGNSFQNEPGSQLFRNSNRQDYNGPVNVIDRGRRDFLRENALRLLQMPPRRPLRCYLNEQGQHAMDLSHAPFVLRPGFGQVPKYLLKRKQELCKEDREARRQAQRQKSSQTRPLSDEDRLRILQGLEDHWSELNSQYLRLPSYGSSNKMDRFRAQLEEKFKELETDIRLFQSTDQIHIANNHNPPNNARY